MDRARFETVEMARERLRQIERSILAKPLPADPPLRGGPGRWYQYTGALELPTAQGTITAFTDANEFMARSLAAFFAALAAEPGLMDFPHAIYLGIEYSPVCYLVLPTGIVAGVRALALSIEGTPHECDIYDAEEREKDASFRQAYGIPPAPYADFPPLATLPLSVLRLWWD